MINVHNSIMYSEWANVTSKTQMYCLQWIYIMFKLMGYFNGVSINWV